MSNKKPLPKRLEDELKSIPRYNPKITPTAGADPFEAERAIFDAAFGNITKRPHSAHKSSVLSDAENSDFASILSRRLADVEVENKELRRKLAEAASRSHRIELENQDLRVTLESLRGNDQYTEVKKLRRENASLLKQVLDMETFLRDYGLVWVGTNRKDVEIVASDASSEQASQSVPFHIFNDKIEELNHIVKSEPAQIIKIGGAARLAHPEESLKRIRVSYYKNGLLINRGPFREVGSETYFAFVRDVMDGYFPSEYKDMAPEGVIFDVVNKSDEVYVAGSEGGQMSREQFLRRLPKNVIRNGEVIDIRDDLSSRIDTPTSLSSVITDNSSNDGKDPVASKGAAVHLLTPVYEDLQASREVTDVTTVQIKQPQGRNVLIAKMRASDTIGNVRVEITRYFASLGSEDVQFDLRSAFPPRCLSDDVTLYEAGLVPNGTLHMKFCA